MYHYPVWMWGSSFRFRSTSGSNSSDSDGLPVHLLQQPKSAHRMVNDPFSLSIILPSVLWDLLIPRLWEHKNPCTRLFCCRSQETPVKKKKKRLRSFKERNRLRPERLRNNTTLTALQNNTSENVKGSEHIPLRLMNLMNLNDTDERITFAGIQPDWREHSQRGRPREACGKTQEKMAGTL